MLAVLGRYCRTFSLPSKGFHHLADVLRKQAGLQRGKVLFALAGLPNPLGTAEGSCQLLGTCGEKWPEPRWRWVAS